MSVSELDVLEISEDYMRGQTRIQEPGSCNLARSHIGLTADSAIAHSLIF